MAEVKRVLFPIDLSNAAREIAPWVDLMARQFNAELHMLHVVPDMDFWGVPYAVSPKVMDNQQELTAVAQDKVREFCEEHLKNQPEIKTAVVVGDPADQILKYISDQAVSLVILGTHGRRGVERAIFGSVTDRVLRLSPVPVMCIRPSQAGG